MHLITHSLIPGAGGVRLHAAESGSGPLLLFLHGFPEFWYAWRVQLREFSRDYRAMAVDLRGYNESDKPSKVSDYAMPLLLEDIRQVIRSQSAHQQAIVVGHDWGGIIAWTLARESPELVSRLVIINAPHPAVFSRLITGSPRQLISSSYVGFFQLRWLPEEVLTAFRFAALRRTVFGLARQPNRFTAEDEAAYLQAWQQPGAIRAGLNYYRASRSLREAAAKPESWQIRPPTLVLWGERDLFLRPENLDGLETFVPQLTVRRHARATHWIVHEEPAWIHQQIHEFLATPIGNRVTHPRVVPRS